MDGVGLLFKEAYRHCLSLINAFPVVLRRFYNGKGSRSCQRVRSGKQIKMVKIVCHTKLMNPTFTDSDFLLKSICFDKKLASPQAIYFNEHHI